MEKSSANTLGVLIGLSWLLCLPALAQAPPRYEVNPFWPKELPNNWMIGHVEGIVADKDDHIWVLQHVRTMDHPVDHSDMGLAQKPPLSECCIAAPEVIEFDTDGNVLKAWGGPGYTPDSPDWPEAASGFWVDKSENVWVSGNHAPDRMVLKFSSDGKLLLKIGRFTGQAGRPELAQPNNQDTALLGGPTSITVDDEAKEVYIADGTINKRVVVYDSNTGEFKRGWGAYGIPLSEINNSKNGSAPAFDPTAPPYKQFRRPGCIRLSADGLVYVVDGPSRRIQIFTKEGKFVKEFFIAASSLVFSRDPDQKYLLVSDGEGGGGRNVIRILDRKNGSVLSTFGHPGRNAGQFDFLTALALDSHGDLCVGEVKYNNRIQKFILEK